MNVLEMDSRLKYDDSLYSFVPHLTLFVENCTTNSILKEGAIFDNTFRKLHESINIHSPNLTCLWPLLLTWTNFNPNMDK